MCRFALVLPLAALLAACGSDPPPPAGGDLVVTLDPVTIAPQEEVVYCEYLPADGTERWLTSFTTEMTAGSHHLLVFRVDEAAADTPPTPGRRVCDQLDLPQGLDGMFPGSQQPHTEVALPDGVAMRLGPRQGLFFQFHYFNPTAAPLIANISWRARTVPAAAVKSPAGMMFYSNFDLMVPPGTSQATLSCVVPTERTLLGATGHMHRRGTFFDAALDGADVYHSDSWLEAPLTAFPAPGMHVARGARMSWTCTYANAGTQTYSFGPSALDNEMCILAAIYYPAVPGNELDLGCPDK
jgi:hypothetical protein